MTEEKNHKVIIIGSGPAGYTAAVYAARANLAPLMIAGPLPGGQLTTTTDVENYPGFTDGIMGPDLMLAMEGQAKRFGTEMIQDLVTEIDVTQRPYRLKTQNNDEFTAEAVILAMGANPRLLGVPGESELMGYGVSTCATCDGAFFREQVIVVVGGGDSACEEALFLTKFGSKVYLVHRRDELRASKIMADRVEKNEKVEVLWNKQLAEVIGDKEDGVTGIKLFHSQTKEEETLECSACFIAIGHTPNSDLVKGKLELDDNGYVLTASDSTATNIPGVYACGDLQDHVYRQAITAAGTGCMAAIELERWLEAQD